jgi:hypothetical protein
MPMNQITMEEFSCAMVSLFYPPAFSIRLPKNSLQICELFSDSVEEKENIEEK